MALSPPRYGIGLREKNAMFVNVAFVTYENNIQIVGRQVAFRDFFANAPDMTEYFTIQRNDELQTLNIILAKHFYDWDNSDWVRTFCYDLGSVFQYSCIQNVRIELWVRTVLPAVLRGLHFSSRPVHTMEPGYNDIGLCDTSSIASDILWCQLIPHC